MKHKEAQNYTMMTQVRKLPCGWEEIWQEKAEGISLGALKIHNLYGDGSYIGAHHCQNSWNWACKIFSILLHVSYVFQKQSKTKHSQSLLKILHHYWVFSNLKILAARRGESVWFCCLIYRHWLTCRFLWSQVCLCNNRHRLKRLSISVAKTQSYFHFGSNADTSLVILSEKGWKGPWCVNIYHANQVRGKGV